MAQRAQALGAAPPSWGAASGARSGAAWAAGLLWLAAGLGAGYWFLRTQGLGPWVPVRGMAPSALVVEVDTVARALGATVAADQPVAAAAPQARLQLLGVVAQGRHQGAALIAVDGQPPRPWRVGAAVSDGLVLQSIGPRSVQLGATLAGPATMELTVPSEPVDGGPG